jgi:serine/threonine-protein kinase
MECTTSRAELVTGNTLRQLLKQPLELSQSLEFARQILQGLAAARNEGIIHRDLKPENIMIRADGYVKVLDFGIARLVSGSPLVDADGSLSDTLTATGSIADTFAYMSPEQALGRPIDTATDLFSFGIVFYEMIAGRQSWTRQNGLDTAHAIIHEAAPPLPSSSISMERDSRHSRLY